MNKDIVLSVVPNRGNRCEFNTGVTGQISIFLKSIIMNFDDLHKDTSFFFFYMIYLIQSQT